jgi:hypothetical protein
LANGEAGRLDHNDQTKTKAKLQPIHDFLLLPEMIIPLQDVSSV